MDEVYKKNKRFKWLFEDIMTIEFCQKWWIGGDWQSEEKLEAWIVQWYKGKMVNIKSQGLGWEINGKAFEERNAMMYWIKSDAQKLLRIAECVLKISAYREKFWDVVQVYPTTWREFRFPIFVSFGVFVRSCVLLLFLFLLCFNRPSVPLL